MCNLYERIQTACESRGMTVSAMCIKLGMSKSVLSDLKSGRKKTLAADTVAKIAEFLDVSADYLLRNENAPTASGERKVRDEDIKFALFGGDSEITDAMYEEVRKFAAYVKQREAEKKE